MSIPQFTQEHLQRTVEQWLRRNPDPTAADIQQMTERLYSEQRPEGRGNRSDYGRIVNQVVNMWNTAQQLNENRDIRGTGLPTSGAIPQTAPMFRYLVIVVGYNAAGEEVTSSAVWVESDTTLSANELHGMAIDNVLPWAQKYQEKFDVMSIVRYETFVQLAGQRARA